MSEEEVVRVYRGAREHAVHDGMFFSSSRDEASTYGSIRTYDLPLGRVFDSLDRATIEPLLPLVDPWDDGDIETFEEYLERSADTWSTIEGILDEIGSYDTLRITEGGVVNFLVLDGSRVPEPLPEPATPAP